MPSNTGAFIENRDRDYQRAAALQSLLNQVHVTQDYQKLLRLCRKRRKIKAAAQSEKRRIAILGGANTDYLEDPLQLELESLGIETTICRSDYNSFVYEILNSSSNTSVFRPDIAVLLPTPFNLDAWPGIGDSPEQVHSLAERTADYWLGLCAVLHDRTGCDVVLGNFHLLPTTPMGNLGCRYSWDKNSFIRQLNVELNHRSPGYVHIFDIDTLSSYFGINVWFDMRYWHVAKQPVSFQCLVPYARKLSAVISAIYGKAAKCVVLDLDNTLWGGVVGDDGVQGVRIGQGDAESEAFLAFQEYLLQLKQRGLLLAVSSKNDPEVARAAFQQREDMALKLDDFVAFEAGWAPKPQSLVRIAEQLNIGLESLVFVDDNPFERDLMRQSLPQVRVIELPRDPSEFPQAVDRCGWLEYAQYTEEDRNKTEQYKQNIEREKLQEFHENYKDFLASLGQRAVVADFDTGHSDRIAQLINKTNQFNLTTRRMTVSEVDSARNDPNMVALYVRLSDRFGDNGIISILIGKKSGDVLEIDVWLMSCRVLRRGVEHMLANCLFERARSMGVRRVRGFYRPTAKNSMVKTLYSELGFQLEQEEQDGTTTWMRDVERYVPFPVQISIVENAHG